MAIGFDYQRELMEHFSAVSDKVWTGAYIGKSRYIRFSVNQKSYALPEEAIVGINFYAAKGMCPLPVEAVMGVLSDEAKCLSGVFPNRNDVVLERPLPASHPVIFPLEPEKGFILVRRLEAMVRKRPAPDRHFGI